MTAPTSGATATPQPHSVTDPICNYCLKPTTDDRVQLACRHIFHKECLQRSMSFPSCPQCVVVEAYIRGLEPPRNELTWGL